MELGHVIEGDRALLYMERYVDEGTRTYSPFAARSEVAPQFRPRSDRPSFPLVAVHVPREQVEVAPTASTRTVLTTATHQNVPHHFIKLHYPRRISRFNRRLRRKNIFNSIEATRDVAHVRLDKFAYLPDAIGFLYGHDESAWGFLVREATPRPSMEKP